MNNTQCCGRHEAIPLANILDHSSYKLKQHLELENCNFLTLYVYHKKASEILEWIMNFKTMVIWDVM